MGFPTPELEDTKLCYSVDEAARALGLSRVTVYSMINAGELDAIKVRQRTLITAVTLRQVVAKAPRKGRA